MTDLKTLTPDLREYVDRKLESGEFQSEDEIVAEALREMRAREEALRELLTERITEADRGEFSERNALDIARDVKAEMQSK